MSQYMVIVQTLHHCLLVQVTGHLDYRNKLNYLLTLVGVKVAEGEEPGLRGLAGNKLSQPAAKPTSYISPDTESSIEPYRGQHGEKVEVLVIRQKSMDSEYVTENLNNNAENCEQTVKSDLCHSKTVETVEKGTAEKGTAEVRQPEDMEQSLQTASDDLMQFTQ